MVCSHLFLVCEVSNVLTNNFKHHALSGSEEISLSHLWFERPVIILYLCFTLVHFLRIENSRFHHFPFKIISACFYYHVQGPKGEKGDPGPQVRLGGFHSF